MTYDESAALMNDPAFRGRVKVSALQFAATINSEATDTPAHNTRMKWATNCMQVPDTVAIQLQAPVVMEASVQAAGSDITDADLQTAVESVVNKLM